MLIDRNIPFYAARDTASIQEVANKIAANRKGRIVMVIDGNGVMLGTLSNGDLIRWLGSGSPGGIGATALSISCRNFRSARIDESRDRISSLLNDVLYVPLLDSRGRLVAVASSRAPGDGIEIEGRRIASDAPSMAIAEIGNNHNGSFQLAIELINAARSAGADCIKFQMRDMQTLYGGAQIGSITSENLGTQYVLDLLARQQLPDDDLFRCFDHVRDLGLLPLCTPWDMASLEKLDRYGLPAIKISSADFTNHDLLMAAGQTGKPLICSTGMTTEEEIRQTTRQLQRAGVGYVLLHCNSTYPTPFRDVNLEYLQHLARIGQCTVGYSGHERDIFVPVAAVAMGARVVEKHFTLDRSMEGSDHRISLLPAEFTRMVEGIRQVEEATGSDAPRRISQGEMLNRVTLAKSVFARVDVAAGQVIEESMLAVRSPGRGLQPHRKLELVGRQLRRPVNAGEPFFPSDLDGSEPATRGNVRMDFSRPWGLPVRHHDYANLLRLFEPDFLEFHLSYRDLELPDEQFFPPGRMPINLVVHAPELFHGDHLLDLCAVDEMYRRRSVSSMQQVIEKSRSLRRFFAPGGPIGIVTNVGGFSLDRPLTRSERAARRDNLRRSLDEIVADDIEIWPQTMPPFPWHFGGQRFHNLFVDAEDIANLCRTLGVGVCLDVSHSRLACNVQKTSFDDFLNVVGGHTRHLHIADASGHDGEGLQIGDGDIDFRALFRKLDELAPGASFLPEVWQGHENDGEGFRVAFDRLRTLLDVSAHPQ
ncbi:MAG: N-acetylneuraminate synthase family protein [Steroidobacteraceae bacterium]